MSHAFGFDPGLTRRWRGAVEAHKSHAHAEWPREACGLILADGGYHPCANVAHDPLASFAIEPDEVLEAADGHPAAVLHSHPSHNDPVTGWLVPPLDCPSRHDMRAQMDMAVPWGITLCTETGASDPFWFGDQVERPPLVGRSFRHGVDDCYALVRDWHRTAAGIVLPDYPRDPDWWQAGETLYDRFDEAGFARVGRAKADPLPGDCFICAIRSLVPNHAGIYLGGGLILHHLAHQLSARQPASVWRSKMDFLVRHRDLPGDWTP